MPFHIRDFLYLLGWLEGSDLTGGFGPCLGLFLAFDRVIHLLRRRDVERVGLSDEGCSFLRNAKSRRPGGGDDRGVPLVGIEVLGGGHDIILIPLQVVHQTVLGATGVGGRGGAHTVARGIVKVNGEDTSLWV